MKSNFFISFLFVTLKLLSQEGYVDGYYITNLNDTIPAKINFKITKSKVSVIENNGEKKQFKPNQIKGFGKLGLEVYKSVDFGNIFSKKPDVFVKVVELGYLSLYQSYMGKDPYNVSQGSGLGSNEADDKFYCIQYKADSTKLFSLYPPLFFKRNMKNVIGDDSITYSKVANGVYGYYELPLIVKEYNERKKNKGYYPTSSNNFLKQNEINTHENYKWGYYVTLNSDTIDCEIYDKNFLFGPQLTKISVYEKDGSKKTLGVDDIKGYGKRDLHNFRSIKLSKNSSERKFAKILEDGFLVLFFYQIRVQKGERWFDEDHYFLQRKNEDKSIEECTSGNFIDVLSRFIEDNETLSMQLKEKQFKFEDLNLIIKKYNLDKANK